MTTPATTLAVVAPLPGRVLPITEVPDPVFAAELVGPGVAIDPPRGPVEAVAPVAGRLVKVHPHAFVVQPAAGPAVLVHLGIDTVQLRGAGFTLHAAEGAEVAAGDRLVSWDAAAVAEGGRSPVCPVVALDTPAIEVAADALAAASVAAGATLFTVPGPA